MELSPLIVAGISFLMIFVALSTGMWVFATLMMVALICAAVFMGNMGLIPFVPFASANAHSLTAIATFVLMGEIMLRTGITRSLVQGAVALLRRFPGCLYHANIFAAAIFGAVSGSSLASSATIGTVSLPELYKRGYQREIALGTIAGGGTLGNIIPPSITMIVYGACTGESIGRVFIAVIIPGIILVLMMMSYIGITVKIHPDYAPVSARGTFKQTAKDVAGLLPFLAIAVIILGSIYLGVATPTEAGAVGAICAIVLAAAYRTLNWENVKEAAFAAVKTSCMLMLLIVASSLLASVYGAIKLPAITAEWTASLGTSPLVILIGVYIFYLIMGCFIDTIPVMVMTLGVIYPLMMGLGYNGVWLGVVISLLAVAGLITPPVGLSLYVTQALAPDSTLMQVY